MLKFLLILVILIFAANYIAFCFSYLDGFSTVTGFGAFWDTFKSSVAALFDHPLWWMAPSEYVGEFAPAAPIETPAIQQ